MSASQITINGTIFKRYFAMDSHRTRLTHYWINNRLVDKEEFDKSVKERIQEHGGEYIVLGALKAFRY